MTHKFKVGDKVKVVQAGLGCSYSEKGTVTVITGLREDYMEDEPGYDVKDLENGEFPIGESSFELVESSSEIDRLKKEIADKQRELQALYDAEKEEQYHFKANMSWEEIAEKILELTKNLDLKGSVISENDNVMINLHVSPSISVNDKYIFKED